MRKNRRLRKAPQAQIARHLKRIGFSDTGEYLRWCVCNGFPQRLMKSDEDRRTELLHAVTCGPGWRTLPATEHKLTIRVQGAPTEVEEKIFSGQLSSRHEVDRQYRPLVKAVARMAGPCFDRHQAELRRLVSLCRDRGLDLFCYGGRVPVGCPGSTIAEALALIVMDREHWVRSPDEWRAPSGSHFACFRDLVSHLYAQHALPEFLFGVWFPADLDELEFSTRVFRHIAAGHSVRTLPIGLPFSRRMSHFFLLAPPRLTVRQALRWGQVRGMGGSERLADAVAASVLGRKVSDEPFWASVIGWLMKNPIEPSHIGTVIRYLDNQRFGTGNPDRYIRDYRGRIRRESMPAAQPGLTMRGRTPRSLLRDVRRFVRSEELYGRGSEFVWAESGISPFDYQDAKGRRWTIAELLGNGALVQEGQCMNHCVGGYAEDCVRGDSTIWSMCEQTINGSKHVLTLEVDPLTREIVEARGFANRLPTPREMDVLRKWGQSAGLDLRPIETY